MKNTIKIFITALTIAAGASSFAVTADAMKMSKQDMMSMQPMMCTMSPGKEAAGKGPMCLSNDDAKKMIMTKHMKFRAMMCMMPAGQEAAGRAGYGFTCMTDHKYKTMMKHM